MDGMQAPGGGMTGAEPLSLPRFEESDPSDVISKLIAEVQGEIENPAPNRTAFIQDGRRGNREYSYTTLNVILDLVRPMLARRGILVGYQFGKTGNIHELTTRYKHAESGQWMACTVPMFGANNMHEFTAAATMARRYSHQLLVNLCTDADTDGGNATSDAPRAAAGAHVEPYDKLLGAAEGLCVLETPNPTRGTALIKLWNANAELADMRFERSTRPRWEALEQAMTEALGSTFGKSFGAAWAAIFRARTHDELDAVRVEYDTKFRAEIELLRATAPTAVQHLVGHLMNQAKLIAERIDNHIAIDKEVGAVEARAEAEAPKGYCLFDCHGEAISDPFYAPVDFANAYVDEWIATDRDDRLALQEHNEAALRLLADDADAVTALEVIGQHLEDERQQDETVRPGDETPLALPAPSPERAATDAALDDDQIPDWDAPAPTDDAQLPVSMLVEEEDEGPLRTARAVDLPRRANGSPDLLSFIRDIENSLAAVCDVPAMEAWIEANTATYMADRFPIGTRVKVMNLVTARKRALGMRSDADE